MTRPSKPFLARYDSNCPECGDRIVADLDEIVMDDGVAVHEGCAEPTAAEPNLPTFPI